MSLLFSAVPFCLYTAVGNSLSFVSCVCSALPFSAALQPGRSGKSSPTFQNLKYCARVEADQSNPAAPTRGAANRAQQVPAVVRSMRKAEHGRRKKVWLTIIVLSVHIWGIYRLAERFLAKGFCMINDAVLCQEDNAAKHILVSKQAETWTCATGMLYASSPRVTITP